MKFFALLTLLLGHLNVWAATLEDLSHLEVEPEFRALLAAMPIQLESGGAKIFKLRDGSVWVVSIGSTKANPASGSELVRRRTVARVKAQAHAVAEINGTEVKATVVATTKDKTTISNGAETGFSEETLDETIVTSARGALQEMQPVGSWMNKENSVFFMAIGKRLK
jgi:hypothetical protein